MKYLILILFGISYFSCFSQDTTNSNPFGSEYQAFKIDDNTTYYYKSPKKFEFVTNVWDSYVDFADSAFQLRHWPEYSIITSSTLLTWYYDQELLDESQRFGRRLGIGNSDKTSTYLEISGLPIFRGPKDWGSAMYFIGDGWFHLSWSLGFYVKGLISDDNRALQTASQIAEGMLTTGIATQFLKHVTGRESPYVATVDRGKWRFFPDQVEYHKHVPHYDAYPSGHIATAMMTYTVISDNYPEYSYIITPVGYTLMGLLMYQMMNNGVHWASDYPLGIALGYVFGKVAVNKGRKVVRNNMFSEDKSWTDNLNISTSLNRFGGVSLNLTYTIK